MPVTRREVLRAAIALPAGAAAAALAIRAGDAIRSAATGLRPTADGTSATRCAACGGRDHAMLDRRCPAARRVI